MTTIQERIKINDQEIDSAFPPKAVFKDDVATVRLLAVVFMPS